MRYSSKGLSGLIICGECGRNYQCSTRTKNGEKFLCGGVPADWSRVTRVVRIQLTVLEEDIVDQLGMDKRDEKLIRKEVKRITVKTNRIILSK